MSALMSKSIKAGSKTDKKRSQWPRVREIPGRPQPWMVDARIAGKGTRYFYATVTEADTKADQLRIGRINGGTASAQFPEAHRIMAAQCIAQLAAVGATLREATDFYVSHAKPADGPLTVTALVAKFLLAKTQAGRKAEYLRVQGHVLGKFAKAFGEREAHTLGHAEISQWMQEQKWALRTWDNYRKDLRNLYGFAIKHNHCAQNPLAKLEVATLDEGAPAILSVEQCAALLTTAATFDGGSLLAYTAIGLFAGLRASEIMTLDWREVSLAERTIEVVAKKAKTRARRIVHMSENLAAWLKSCAKPSGPVTPALQLKIKWQRLREAAGVRLAKGGTGSAWGKNSMRHSFASYHVAMHQNAPKTSLEMGHDNPDQLFQSYRNVVKAKAAQRFWDLKPAGGSRKIVQMAA